MSDNGDHSRFDCTRAPPSFPQMSPGSKSGLIRVSSGRISRDEVHQDVVLPNEFATSVVRSR